MTGCSISNCWTVKRRARFNSACGTSEKTHPHSPNSLGGPVGTVKIDERIKVGYKVIRMRCRCGHWDGRGGQDANTHCCTQKTGKRAERILRYQRITRSRSLGCHQNRRRLGNITLGRGRGPNSLLPARTREASLSSWSRAEGDIVIRVARPRGETRIRSPHARGGTTGRLPDSPPADS